MESQRGYSVRSYHFGEFSTRGRKRWPVAVPVSDVSSGKARYVAVRDLASPERDEETVTASELFGEFYAEADKTCSKREFNPISVYFSWFTRLRQDIVSALAGASPSFLSR